MSKIIEGLKYSDTHEWVKVEGDIAVIGVTDFAQKEMGEITYVDCPDVDDEVEKGSEFGALESVKAASDLFSPVSGTVTEVTSPFPNSAYHSFWRPSWYPLLSGHLFYAFRSSLHNT